MRAPLSRNRQPATALLEDCHHFYQQQQSEDGDKGDTSEERQQLQPIELARSLSGGLEELVAAMPIKVMKRRLHELGANPARLAACLEKVICSSLARFFRLPGTD